MHELSSHPNLSPRIIPQRHDLEIHLTPTVDAATGRFRRVDFRLHRRPRTGGNALPTHAGVPVSIESLRAMADAFRQLADALEGL